MIKFLKKLLIMNKTNEYNYLVKFYMVYEIKPEHIADYKHSDAYKKFKEAFPRESKIPENIAGNIAEELLAEALHDGSGINTTYFNISIVKSKINEDD